MPISLKPDADPNGRVIRPPRAIRKGMGKYVEAIEETMQRANKKANKDKNEVIDGEGKQKAGEGSHDTEGSEDGTSRSRTAGPQKNASASNVKPKEHATTSPAENGVQRRVDRQMSLIKIWTFGDACAIPFLQNSAITSLTPILAGERPTIHAVIYAFANVSATSKLIKLPVTSVHFHFWQPFYYYSNKQAETDRELEQMCSIPGPVSCPRDVGQEGKRKGHSYYKACQKQGSLVLRISFDPCNYRV